MLKNQIAKSNNGIERSKYITFGIPAEGIAEARPRLERVEADVMGNFKRLGVPSEPMDGRARLALLHSQMHPRNREAFRFSWKDMLTQQKILYANDPDSIYMAVEGPRNANGDDPLRPTTTINGWTVTLISKNCKHPERAIARHHTDIRSPFFLQTYQHTHADGMYACLYRLRNWNR